MKQGISGIVIVYNQVVLLDECLKSLSGWVDELIVVDLNSTEDITKVVKKHKAIYKKLPYADIVEKVREKVLSFASHEYVIFLDPDETVPIPLAKYIKTEVKKNTYDYIRIPRSNVVMGKSLRHSRWWPDYQLRVFKVGKVVWPTEIHQEPIYKGSGITLDANEELALIHRNYMSIDEWFEKNRRYAKRDALDRVQRREVLTLGETVRLSTSELMSRYFANEGYKDGMHGLILSILQSYYYFVVYAYYWEANKYAEIETSGTQYSLPQLWFRHGLSETLFWDHSSSTSMSKIKSKLVRKLIA